MTEVGLYPLLVFRVTGAWLVVGVVALIVLLVEYVFSNRRVSRLFRWQLPSRPQRRIFLAATSFFFTFAAVRLLTYCIHNQIGPFHDIYMGGRHIHHLVWGIALLLIVGYAWLAELGHGAENPSFLLGRMLCLLYGAGAALTLDEFALWLNLRDVYWAREGRASVDAVILFGALLLIGSFGGRFLRALLLDLIRRSASLFRRP